MNPGEEIKVFRIKGFNLLVSFISKLPTVKKLGQEGKSKASAKIGQTVRLSRSAGMAVFY